MLEQRKHPNGVVTIQSTLLERAGVRHGFSTRIGGVSRGVFESLNLGNPQGAIRDTDANIQENYGRLLEALGLAGRKPCRVHQVHGREIVMLRKGDEPPAGRQADALMTDDAGLVVLVRAADCVPILMADRSGRWVAAVHAGWRGMVAGIVPECLAALHHQGAAKGDMIVAVGPCIGVEAFEVGEEVAAEFVREFGEEAPVIRKAGRKPHVDLRRAAVLQARRYGLSEEQIDHADLCTVRDEKLFYSHRRDAGLTGRMVAVISPTAI